MSVIVLAHPEEFLMEDNQTKASEQSNDDEMNEI
jgi:hypothetical protein